MTHDVSSRGHLHGRLRSADGQGIVHIEDRFLADVDDVWSALTVATRLARWLGEFEGELRLGSRFQARFFASGWEGIGQVVLCDPRRRLLVRMKETGGTAEDSLDVTLRAEGGQTALIVEQSGLPQDQLAAYGAGLQLHVEDLASYLSGGERCDARTRWKDLFPVYAAKSIDAA